MCVHLCLTLVLFARTFCRNQRVYLSDQVFINATKPTLHAKDCFSRTGSRCSRSFTVSMLQFFFFTTKMQMWQTVLIHIWCSRCEHIDFCFLEIQLNQLLKKFQNATSVHIFILLMEFACGRRLYDSNVFYVRIIQIWNCQYSIKMCNKSKTLLNCIWVCRLFASDSKQFISLISHMKDKRRGSFLLTDAQIHALMCWYHTHTHTPVISSLCRTTTLL